MIEAGVREPDAASAGIGQALARLRRKGVDDRDIADVVRGMQAQLLFHFCYLLGDPGDVEAEVRDIHWGLVQKDDDDKILDFIGELHESVLETDPSGREMRPRPRPDN